MSETVTIYRPQWRWRPNGLYELRIEKVQGARSEKQIRVAVAAVVAYEIVDPDAACYSLEAALQRMQSGVDNLIKRAEQELAEAAHKQQQIDEYRVKEVS